jgi:hypothetical protein
LVAVNLPYLARVGICGKGEIIERFEREATEWRRLAITGESLALSTIRGPRPADS